VLQTGAGARPDTIASWLEARNFAKAGNGWAKFARAPALPGERQYASELDVRIVETRHRERFGHVVQAGFGLPVSCAGWFSALVGRPRWTAYLAYDGSELVGAGAIFANGKMGWLGIDVTLVDHRRCGAQTALITSCLRDGIAAGFGSF